MSRLARFMFEVRGQSLRATAKICCNKLTYVASRSIGRKPADSRLHADWHWSRYPFSLLHEVLWSSRLQAWFRPEDESAIECMLHMPDYEPVNWIAPKVGDVFLDVGGYVGWYSIQAARAIGAPGQVVVFEPDSVNRGQLERNLELNSIHNTRVLPLAVWSTSCEVGWRQGDQPVWHSVDRLEGGDTRQAISIDDAVKLLNLPHVDWIKLDIEGAEIEALEGGFETLAAYHPKLFVEVHETRGRILEILNKFGYRVEREHYDLPPDRHGWMLVAVS